jgi:peptidoglycan-associated lipoprotein
MKRVLPALPLLFLIAACAGDPPPDSAHTGGAGTGAGGDQASRTGAIDPTKGGAAAKDQLEKVFHDTVGDHVFFATDRSDLSAEAQTTLRKQADFMRQYSNLTFTLEGHADERGTREYNLALGDRRATAMRKFLAASGIAENRVRTVSYGKERPEIALSNDQGWAQNRRGITTID